jgi:hypothetical protein
MIICLRRFTVSKAVATWFVTIIQCRPFYNSCLQTCYAAIIVHKVEIAVQPAERNLINSTIHFKHNSPLLV